MRLQRFTNYILTHRWQGLLITLAITFVPIVGTFGILIAGLVTLRKNVIEGFLYTLAATIPFVICAYYTHVLNADMVTPLGMWAAVGVTVLSNLLTWVFASQLRRQASWSQILQVAALMGVLTVSVVHLLYPNVASWWVAQLQNYYDQVPSLMTGQPVVPANTPEQQLELIQVSKNATGFMVAAILLVSLMQLIVVRWWQAILFSPGLLRRELHGIRLSKLAGFLFAVSLVFWYLGNSVILDIMPILCLLFDAAGLSLIHYMFGLMRSPTRWFWIWGMYIFFVFTLPTSVTLVAILALLDAWFDIRKRLNKI